MTEGRQSEKQIVFSFRIFDVFSMANINTYHKSEPLERYFNDRYSLKKKKSRKHMHFVYSQKITTGN